MEATAHHNFEIFIDGEPHQVGSDHVTAREIIEIAGKDPGDHYLIRDRGDGQDGESFAERADDPIQISAGDRFTTVATVEPLQIFVNRRPFGRIDGVKKHMTGGEIATLVHVPLDKAVIKRVKGEEHIDVGVNETIEVHNDEHFLVTRDHVDGG